jgi:hypothetical protein
MDAIRVAASNTTPIQPREEERAPFITHSRRWSHLTI